jgi:hypothetical protein
MIPPFRRDGSLPAGLHQAAWDDVVDRFGGNPTRDRLLTGLRAALDSLAAAGCSVVYLDGSFVTAKAIPGDFDGCWDVAGVAIAALDPALRTFDSGRATQKSAFGRELFPAHFAADGAGTTYLDFFQRDRRTGRRKGVVVVDPRSR